MKQKAFTLAGLLCTRLLLVAQTQTTYTGTNITGQLVLTRTVSPSLLGANRTLSSRTTQGTGRPANQDPALNQLPPEPSAPADVFEEVPKLLR